MAEPYEHAGDGEARSFTRFSSKESYSHDGSEDGDEREEGDE